MQQFLLNNILIVQIECKFQKVETFYDLKKNTFSSVYELSNLMLTSPETVRIL